MTKNGTHSARGYRTNPGGQNEIHHKAVNHFLDPVYNNWYMSAYMGEHSMTKINQGHHGYAVLSEAEERGHVGFCMSRYDMTKCCDCFAEEECLDLFVKDVAVGLAAIKIMEDCWTRAQYLQLNGLDRGN
jgi:hypothetical protein